jgi:hypothetical protein
MSETTTREMPVPGPETKFHKKLRSQSRIIKKMTVPKMHPVHTEGRPEIKLEYGDIDAPEKARIDKANEKYAEMCDLLQINQQVGNETLFWLAALPPGQTAHLCHQLATCPEESFDRCVVLMNEAFDGVQFPWLHHWMTLYWPDENPGNEWCTERHLHWFENVTRPQLKDMHLQLADAYAAFPDLRQEVIFDYPDLLWAPEARDQIEQALLMTADPRFGMIEDKETRRAILVRGDYSEDQFRAAAERLAEDKEGLALLALANPQYDLKKQS